MGKLRAFTLVCVAAAVLGCAMFAYAPPAGTDIHLAAKAATYGLWRLDELTGTRVLTIDQLERAEPFIAAARDALSAESEGDLQSALKVFLSAQIDRAADPVDRLILAEIMGAVVDGVKLQDPAALEGKSAENARLVLDGILDGIAYARWASAELAAEDAAGSPPQ